MFLKTSSVKATFMPDSIGSVPIFPIFPYIPWYTFEDISHDGFIRHKILSPGSPKGQDHFL